MLSAIGCMLSIVMSSIFAIAGMINKSARFARVKDSLHAQIDKRTSLVVHESGGLKSENWSLRSISMEETEAAGLPNQ